MDEEKKEEERERKHSQVLIFPHRRTSWILFLMEQGPLRGMERGEGGKERREEVGRV